MLTIALMVALHLNLSCFAMLTSCHLFSVRPEISPWTALENLAVHSMWCTQKKRKKRTSTIGLSKQRVLKTNPTIKFSKKKLWKINPIDKKLHHFEVAMESLR
jgi:hypothetical protein